MLADEDVPPKRRLDRWIRRAAKGLMACGGIGFIVSVGWWYAFFEQMLGTDVKTASECFYRTTLECQVGNFVGSFMDTAPYEPYYMWASCLVVGIGFVIYAFTPKS